MTLWAWISRQREPPSWPGRKEEQKARNRRGCASEVLMSSSPAEPEKNPAEAGFFSGSDPVTLLKVDGVPSCLRMKVKSAHGPYELGDTGDMAGTGQEMVGAHFRVKERFYWQRFEGLFIGQSSPCCCPHTWPKFTG